MANTKIQKTSPPVIAKSLKYSVITTFVNFNPKKHGPRTIIVNGVVAIRLKGNIYTKM